jgi:hypothetical protein
MCSLKVWFAFSAGVLSTLLTGSHDYALGQPLPDPSLTQFGGASDQRGAAISVQDDGLYAAGQGPPSFLVRYTKPPGAPVWSRTEPTALNYFALASLPTTVFAFGNAVPSNCGASDGVGDTEAKSALIRVGSDGSTGGCVSPNFFSYRGGELYFAGTAMSVGGTAYLFGGGLAENCGFGHALFTLARHDTSMNLLNRATEPTTTFGAFDCMGFSYVLGLTSLNGQIYAAGYSNLTSEDGGVGTGVARPILMKYDATLNRLWKRRPNDYSSGAFRAVTAFQGAIFAVGNTFAPNPGGSQPDTTILGDYLIEKYDEDGNRLWTKTSGGAGIDVLTGIAAAGTRLFAVGYTQGAGRDAVVLEIDPANGNILQTKIIGGAEDDQANGAAGDASRLYVIGETRSSATPEGNVVGQNDMAIWTFDVTVADTTPPMITPAITGTLGLNGWYVSNVDVSWTVSDLESGISSSTGCGTTNLTADTGGTTLTCSATNGASLSTSASVTIKIDKTPPTVAVTGVANSSTYTLGAVPAAGCTTTDALSGVAVNATLAVTGGTANGVGSFTATCTGGKDNAGNTAAPASVTYSVHYAFAGFFSPVSIGVYNLVNAGQSVAMKWQLTNSSDAFISALTAVSFITSANLPCGGEAISPPLQADTSGASGLHYDTTSNQYIFSWKTDKSWGGSCRRFLLLLDDGTTHTADFTLK